MRTEKPCVASENLRRSWMNLNKSIKEKRRRGGVEEGNSKMEEALDRASGSRIFFELLNVALLDLLHEGFALEEIIMEVGGELARHGEELIVNDFREGDRAARGDQVRAPLEHEAVVPEDEESQGDASGSEGGSARAERLRGAVQENREAKNEE
jgi:hypothetical protein